MSEHIDGNCSACGNIFKVTSKLAGKRVKCPSCKEPVRLPGGAPAKAAPLALDTAAGSLGQQKSAAAKKPTVAATPAAPPKRTRTAQPAPVVDEPPVLDSSVFEIVVDEEATTTKKRKSSSRNSKRSAGSSSRSKSRSRKSDDFDDFEDFDDGIEEVDEYDDFEDDYLESDTRPRRRTSSRTSSSRSKSRSKRKKGRSAEQHQPTAVGRILAVVGGLVMLGLGGYLMVLAVNNPGNARRFKGPIFLLVFGLLTLVGGITGKKFG